MLNLVGASVSFSPLPNNASAPNSESFKKVNMINKTAINPQQFQKPIPKNLKFPQPTLPNCILIILIHSLQSQATISSSYPTPPPIPILPIPTSQQLSWQLTEMALFLHFGTNTFTDSEWGTGHANPKVFNPTALNATQWVNSLEKWDRDVVKDLAEAARIGGVQLGLYLSPWDRHEPCYGKTLEYNEYYLGQMTELLTRYGEITEVWLDGAKGEGEKDMEYFFDDWFSLIHQLQPGAVIFSDAGPDVRWVGDEAGVAGTTCWSLFNQSDAKIGDTDRVSQIVMDRPMEIFRRGRSIRHDWVPAECDVSIRPGWFWHPSEVPKSAITLLDLYYKSVGRNCLLLLNVPPNSSGLISQEDIQVLQEFSKPSSIFSHNLAKGASILASSTRGNPNDSRYSPHNVLEDGIYSYWAPDEAQSDWMLYINFQEVITFNVLLLQEPIQMGQRIIQFHLDFLNEDGEWEVVTSGTTVGYKRLLLFSSVKTSHLRVVVDKSRADPLISYLGIYMDPFSIFGHVSKLWSGPRVNGSELLQQTTGRNSNSSDM
ncbi:hypothetical protein DH2020_000281 [Rehmannia glutinosa]|uniref:alpha-L-fucosidase n=1 Tax=Rehmannia glutinosa TaxID=99300 RepID=A0ABR0XW16_REHGL